MKKQKKHRPKAKRPVVAPPVAAASSVARASSKSANRRPVQDQTPSRVERRVETSATPRKPAAVRGAFADAVTYSSDDRQALGLLMLPFLLVAFAIGSSQSLRWRPAYNDQMAAPAPVTSTPPVLISKVPESLAPGRPSAVELQKQAASPALTSSESAPPGVVAAVPQSLTPDSSTMAVQPPAAVAELAPAAPLQSVVPTAPSSLPATADTVPEVEQPSSLKPSTALPELNAAPQSPSLSPSRPMELAALPGVQDLPLPGSITAPPVAPENVCTAEAPKPAIAKPERLAALGGEAGSASVDPIAFGMELAAAAREQLDDFTVYTDQYRTIAYPNGDVPQFYGVCTDVIIRAYRVLGIDLQALVHQSKLGSGDTNIDHRRVGTLQKFMTAYGVSLPISEFSEDYWPGDIISYYRPQNAHSRSHIAIVSDVVGPSGNFMIIHNRGWGPQQEDALFVDQMTGHYRYSATRRPAVATKPPVAAKTQASPVAKKKQTQPGNAGARASLAPKETGAAVAR